MTDEKLLNDDIHRIDEYIKNNASIFRLQKLLQSMSDDDVFFGVSGLNLSSVNEEYYKSVNDLLSVREELVAKLELIKQEKIEKIEREKKRKIIIRRATCISFTIIMLIGILGHIFVRPVIIESNVNRALNNNMFDEAIEIYEKRNTDKKYDKEIEECIRMKAEYELSEGRYDSSIALYESINISERYDNEIDECYYLKGIHLLKSNLYAEAANMFKHNENYEDSEEKIKWCYYQEGILLAEKKEYANAIQLLEQLPEDYNDTIDLINEYVVKLAEKLIGEGDYFSCQSVLKKWNKKDLEWYQQACYYVGVENMRVKEYSSAIDFFKESKGYSDSNQLIKECENVINYKQAVEYLEKGDLNNGKTLLGNVDNDYKNTSKLLNLINQYKKYNRVWEAKTYRIYDPDRGITHNLDYTASDGDITGKVKIKEDGTVEVRLNGCKAEINGNIAKWYPYELVSETTCTFDISRGTMIKQFYRSDGKKSDTYTYTYYKD